MIDIHSGFDLIIKPFSFYKTLCSHIKMGKSYKWILSFCYNRVNVLSISYKIYFGDEKHLIYVL